jgi:hypothetical protein
MVRTPLPSNHEIMIPNLLTAVLLGITLLSSCKKERLTQNPPPSLDEQAPRIAIKLNPNYLSAEKIDSATLIWETTTGTQEAAMRVSNDTLFAQTNTLSKGNGRLTVQIFSNVKLRHQSLQWEKRVEITLPKKQSINWTAPTGYEDGGWNPRVILIDALSKLTAIIALRPTDPYFLLKNIPEGFKIELERNYARIPGGAEIVAGGLWRCNTVCTNPRGIIENREFFLPLAAQIAGREWKMVETGVGLFGPNGSSGGTLYFNHY